MYRSLELLRYVAAMLVVCVHIPTLNFGLIGVDIFFVISGFVMMHSTERTSKDFLKKRIIRIVPSYYIFTIMTFSVALIAPSILNNTTPDFVHLLKSLAFIPFDKNGIGHFPILFVGWTLNFEIFFYIVFSVALALNSKLRAELTCVFLIAIYHAALSQNEFPFSAYGDEIIFEFLLGIIVFLICVKKHFLRAISLLLLVVVSLILSEGYEIGRFLKWGIPAAIIVAFAVLYIEKLHIPNLVFSLGGCSYVLYLSHPFIIQFFDKITGWFEMGLHFKIAATVSSILLVNLGAFLLFKIIDQPVTNFLRRTVLK